MYVLPCLFAFLFVIGETPNEERPSFKEIKHVLNYPLHLPVTLLSSLSSLEEWPEVTSKWRCSFSLISDMVHASLMSALELSSISSAGLVGVSIGLTGSGVVSIGLVGDQEDV